MYRGEVRIAARGVPSVNVPVEMEVVGWTLPSAREFHTFVGLYESPDTVALQYKVPMWSEKHWGYLEKSWRLLGYLGNNLVVIPLIMRTEFGNDESMVWWVKDSKGGYRYDFSVFDRYLDLAMKYCKIKVVSCQVYYGAGWFAVDPSNRPVEVTVVGPGGARHAEKLPLYGTEEAKRLWRPLVAALRERLKKRGLEKGLVFGIGHCGGMHKTVISFFKEIAPGVGWHIAKHNRPRPREFPRHRYVEWMYIPGLIPVPPKFPRFPNDGKGLICLMMQRLYDFRQSPVSLHTAPERAYLLGDTGIGRLCVDYWPALKDKRGRGHVLYDRWPRARANQRAPQVYYLSIPGKDGALSTQKIEALRQALQEAEARYFIENALRAGRLKGALAERCRKVLERRLVFCQLTHSHPQNQDESLCSGCRWGARARELYRAAAEVAAVTGAK